MAGRHWTQDDEAAWLEELYGREPEPQPLQLWQYTLIYLGILLFSALIWVAAVAGMLHWLGLY